MRARLLTILAALSAVIFIVVAGMWVRTFFATDVVRFEQSTSGQRLHMLQVRWAGDFVHAAWADARFARPAVNPNQRRWSREVYGPQSQGIDSWLWGDHYLDQPSGGGSIEVWRIQVRPWLLLLPPMLLPLIWLRSFLRHRRERREGLCLACGYDLRATPGRCPECGAVSIGAGALRGNV